MYSVEGSHIAEDMRVRFKSLPPPALNHAPPPPPQCLVDSNGCTSSIHVIHGRVEQLQLLSVSAVDILISEPMGTLLFNERMVKYIPSTKHHFYAPTPNYKRA